MKHAGDGIYNKVDVIMHGMETIGSAERATDVEEMMRRVPGLTRKEALRIQQLGLTPDEEVDYAYIVVNNGIDVFYEGN